MEIRGERKCRECGTRWSYYETGSVNCPNCESVHSVGVDERTEHTASPVELDLSAARRMAAEGNYEEATTHAAESCRSYVRSVGFIDRGELLDLDETYLAALELRALAGAIGRRLRLDDGEERYFLALLTGVEDGERPAPEAVPDSLRAERGLSIARGVETYRGEVRTAMEGRSDPTARTAATLLARLAEHGKRIEALDGDVESKHAEALVSATREIASALRTGEENALGRARERLDRLDGV